MQPILGHLGPLTLYSFGLCISLAFILSALLIHQLSLRAGLKVRSFLDTSLYVTLASLLGARLWHVIFRPHDIHNFWQVFSLAGGQLAWPGGLLAGGLTLRYLLKRQGQPLGRWFDIIAIGTTLGLVLGKIGSYLNGDTFGKASKLPWAVHFKDPHSPAYAMGTEIHPLQLYALTLYAVIGVILVRRYLQRPTRSADQHPDGQLFWLALLAVSVVQFLLEFLHAQRDVIYWGGLHMIQVMTVLFAAISIFYLRRLKGAR